MKDHNNNLKKPVGFPLHISLNAERLGPVGRQRAGCSQGCREQLGTLGWSAGRMDGVGVW